MSNACLCVFFSGTVAHKIMQKYGFRDGQGLGKHEQGLSTALSVEKTSKRGGKIIIGDSTEKSEIIHAHTHTHTRTRTQAHRKCVQTHTLQVQNKHPLDLLLFFLVSYLFSTPCFVICTTMLNNPFECVCMFQHQDPVRMWLIHMALIQVWLYLFPVSHISHLLIIFFFHLDHPHVPY